MIVYGSALADGNAHQHNNLPTVLAGRANGSLHPGRHIRYADETPMTNLYLSMLDRIGVPVDQIGDSNGRLDGLSTLARRDVTGKGHRPFVPILYGLRPAKGRTPFVRWASVPGNDRGVGITTTSRSTRRRTSPSPYIQGSTNDQPAVCPTELSSCSGKVTFSLFLRVDIPICYFSA